MPNRLLLIAQSPVLRYGIRMLVESTFPPGDVAEAENGLDVYGMARRFAPDLAIIQDALPGVTGMIAARMIQQLSAATRVIVLADDTELAERSAGGRQGVDALLPMGIEPVDFADVIRMFERTAAATGAEPIPALEIALLDGIARGMSPDAVALAAATPAERIETALAALMIRFKAVDCAGIVAGAVRRGWIDPQAQLPGAAPAISFAVAG